MSEITLSKEGKILEFSIALLLISCQATTASKYRIPKDSINF